MAERYFSDRVVEWYEMNFRSLPWRTTKDPYKIWLSEIILQQTRVSQGLPYYERFVEQFPTIHDLARASEQQVLRLWQGLGYYSRARNLHGCARLVVSDYAGVFPNTYAELKKLPGIGDYTAAAIASIAFQEAVPVVDGNVYRVLARVFGKEDDIAKGSTRKTFFELAGRLIDKVRPGQFNQGIMELGATVCKPTMPDCDACPVKKMCMAKTHSLQDKLPVKSRPRAPKRRYFYYLILEQKGKLVMLQRQGGDIWQGLYDFPLIETPRRLSVNALLETKSVWLQFIRKPAAIRISKGYEHTLSHQKIFTRFIRVTLNTRRSKFPGNARFYSPSQIHNLPKPRLITRYLEELGIS